MKDDINELIIALESLIANIKKSNAIKFDLSINSISIDISSNASEFRQTDTIGKRWDISVEVME